MINPLTGGAFYSTSNRTNYIEKAPDSLNPLYRPIPSNFSIEKRYDNILSVGIECQQPDELKKLLEKNNFMYVYNGFEPSGRMHIAQGILTTINVNKLVDSGCIFIFWVADWFAMLNQKMDGDLEKIRNVGKYFIEIWKAAGMKMSNVKFLWASDFINERPNDYWLQVMSIACKYSLDRVKRCSTIMGRKESDNLKVSQMIYPLMQCSDIFFLDIDICQLGIDQKKVNMLARDYCADTNRSKVPVILSNKMLSGLQRGEEKMSKSTGSAIFMEDSEKEVAKKIKGAFCESGNIEENPCLEYVKYFIFAKTETFEIQRPDEFGGNILYSRYEDLEKDFAEHKLHPRDLKDALTKGINKILEPIRQHFSTDPEAARLFQLVKKYKDEQDKKKAVDTNISKEHEKLLKDKKIPKKEN